MKRLSFLCWVIMLVCARVAHAQDPQLSQYYSAPLYLNPAFTGNLEFDCRKETASRFRFIGNYRNQYRGVFSTIMGSLDYKSKDGNWGFGGLVYQDKQTASTIPLTTTAISGLVSYKLNVIRDWKVHSGLQFGYQNRSTALGNYTYPDMLGQTGVVRPTQEPITGGGNANMLDISGGLLAFNTNYFAGVAVHHLNQPNQTLKGVGSSPDRLPIKISVNTGYRFSFVRERGFARSTMERSVTPTLFYKRQGVTQQLDLGTYFNYDPLILGAWFRGLPIIKSPDGSFQRDVVVLLAGVRVPSDYGFFKLGFSYDVPLSTGTINAGRSFEFSFSYQPLTQKCNRAKNYRSIPCPGL